ncbi:MAG TPA: tetratricopeptide repeat protein, partial [Abditibacteriaceae bacterium]
IPPPIVASYDPRNKPFSVPYAAKGEQVIGRESQLQAVRTQLTQGRRTAIGQTASFQGLGGLGKTQLAVEYAWKYRDTYPNGVIWLNADQDMDAQLIDLSEKARWVARESDHKSKLDIALHRLKSYSDCLLIFDNLEEQETIRDYLPEPGVNPHILVTSRDEQPGFIPVPLELLDSKLSLQLLIQEAEREPDNEDEWQAARDIVSDLDGLPLALELAGAYLRHRPVSWAQYRDLRRQRMQDAILPKHLTFTRHDTDLYSTLRVSEELLDEQPRLRDILDLLTWSGSAPMGLSLLSALIGVENPVELTGALGLGVALRLLKKSAKADSYAIHRLLGEVRRAEKPLAEQGAWVDKVCLRLGDWFQDRREDFADLAVFEAEIDHLSAWQTHAAQLAPHHASRLIWLQTYPPYHRGRYQESQQWVNQAIEVLDRESTPSQELKAHLLADLGTIEGHLGKYEMALAHDREALAIRREVLDEKHPDTANSLNNVGSAYGDLGDHEKQLEYAEQALVVQREALGEKHPDTANSLNNVGNACSNLGRLEQAIDNGRQAVQLATELLGHQHPNTLLYIGNLAVRLRKSGQRWQAFQLLDKTLRDLPRDNPHFEKLAQQARNLLSGKQLRPGFRQPSAKEAERNWGRKK